MNGNQRALLCVAALATLPTLNGCSPGGGGHFVFHPSISFSEYEPNDDPLDANPVGFIAPVDQYVIHGQVDDHGFDLFDGFAFTSDAPVEVEIVLTSHDYFADLDLYVYDPVIDDYVVLFENAGNEFGTFSVYAALTDFHLVVTSFSGSSSYTLEVTGFSPFSPLAASSFAASGSAGQRIAPLEVEPRPSSKSDPEPRVRRYFAATPRASSDEAVATVRRGAILEMTEDGQVHLRRAALLGHRWVVGPRE